MIYNLVSKESFQLSKKEIKNICLLKDNQWKFGIKSQLNWYKKNIKKKDIHNMMFINSKLIGYTLLKRRSCLVNKVLQKYLHFDTLILDKKYRNKKPGNKSVPRDFKIPPPPSMTSRSRVKSIVGRASVCTAKNFGSSIFGEHAIVLAFCQFQEKCSLFCFACYIPLHTSKGV